MDIVKPDLQRHGLGPSRDAAAKSFAYGVQAFYDLAAFAWPQTADFSREWITRLDLYRRISDVMTPGYHEWHEWTNQQIYAMCHERWVGMAGCSNCVAGHTRILNPLTGKEPTIRELTENGIAPTVMTLDGPVIAEVPFVKGVAQLYEITLENGHRFTSTADHRILVSDAGAATPHLYRFCHVSELKIGQFLASYDAILPESILESCLVQNQVRSIRATVKDVFYDIHVPGPEHYFAEGTIHHNSAKTHNVAGFAVNWWLCAPSRSSVIVCCTSISALRKKLWACVQRAYSSMPKSFGNFIDSRRIWQCKAGDDKHSIEGIAVEEGSLIRVADNIKGRHTERLMIVLDEATSIPAAIMDACSNMWSYPQEFLFVMMFNPRSHLDQAGRFAEPDNGWSSISVETPQWKSRPQMDGKNAVILRFDALKSPNITAGKLVSKHLPRADAVEAAKRLSGSEHSPSFWSNFRGYWSPEGIELTVFSEPFLNAHNAYDSFALTGETYIVGGFDPCNTAGGDKAVFYPAKVGWGEDGQLIELLAPIAIPVSAESPTPVAYQLADGLRAAAQAINCPPKNIVVDASSAGLCDILQRTWSADIQRVHFAERASERRVSHEDQRAGRDVYQNKRVEMYFQMKEYFAAGQARGLDKTTALQLCAMKYDPEHGSTKRSMEDKAQVKHRTGRSPDEADACALCFESARRSGVEIRAVGLSALPRGEWEKAVEESQSAWSEDLYESDNATEESDFEEA